MVRLSHKETEQFIEDNYIYYEKIRDIEDRENLVKWIRSANDKWLYVFEDVFYKLHVMGYEVFFRNENWVVTDVINETSELKKGDIIVKINGNDPGECETPFTVQGDMTVDIIRDGEKKQIALHVPECTYTGTRPRLFDEFAPMPSINLCSFSDVDRRELEEIVKEHSHLRIDLRYNMGGSINDMIEVLRIISNQDIEIIVVDAKGVYHRKKVKTAGISNVRKVELLVSDKTASSAEIFVGYLSRICKAMIIGEETVGKFVVHQYIHSEIGEVAVPVYKVLVPRAIVNGVSVSPYFRDRGFSQEDSYKEGDKNEVLIK